MVTTLAHFVSGPKPLQVRSAAYGLDILIVGAGLALCLIMLWDRKTRARRG
jgi:hypothetical protein